MPLQKNAQPTDSIRTTLLVAPEDLELILGSEYYDQTLRGALARLLHS